MESSCTRIFPISRFLDLAIGLEDGEHTVATVVTTRTGERVPGHVNLRLGRYQCFRCGSRGNALELWAAARGVGTIEIALDPYMREYGYPISEDTLVSIDADYVCAKADG